MIVTSNVTHILKRFAQIDRHTINRIIQPRKEMRLEGLNEGDARHKARLRNYETHSVSAKTINYGLLLVALRILDQDGAFEPHDNGRSVSMKLHIHRQKTLEETESSNPMIPRLKSQRISIPSIVTSRSPLII